MQCDLCGSEENVATYGVFPPEHSGQISGTATATWTFDDAHFYKQDYCDTCVSRARKKNVWHAVPFFFMPTVGMMRVFKFSRCSQQEMGDLMVAGFRAHDRNPLEKHILWPMGADGYTSLELYLTREAAEKKLRKQANRK